MASTQANLLQGVWTQLTTTDKNGEVFHLSGHSGVIYLEQTAQPTVTDTTTPTSRVTMERDGFSYYSVAASEFLWAYAINGNVTLTVTPVE